jgi:hypothetical protein
MVTTLLEARVGKAAAATAAIEAGTGAGTGAKK